MTSENTYLFVYGTLLDASNEFAIYLNLHCSFYSTGKVKGKLYDLGEYPGAIADENCTDYIYGNIFILNNSNEALKYLDDYEGFGDEQEQPNLFIRKMITVETDTERLKCWIYLYNLPIKGFKIIESGDYAEYRNLNN